MSDYTTGLIHGIMLSVFSDIISNFITVMILNHIFNKNRIEKIYDKVKDRFKRK